PEAAGRLRLAVAVDDGLAQHLLDLEALAHQHRRLVGEADAGEVALGVEAGAGRVGKAGADLRPLLLAADERADHRRLLAVAYAQVMAAGVGEGLGGGGLGLLVVVLAVDDGGEALA